MTTTVQVSQQVWDGGKDVEDLGNGQGPQKEVHEGVEPRLPPDGGHDEQVCLFAFCLQSFPASGSFPMSHLFTDCNYWITD